MENWGAIFSFEYILLVDPSISTQADRQTIFSVAAHEISHKWFGDLVTMAWWDDLWLNEGFASWMAGRTTEKLHPEWNTALGAVENRDEAMARDALATTHPVVQHIETVEQASQAFDAITYQKGEAVIRMLEGYVGATAWRAGVRRYMQRHAYGNTVSDDLWRAMEASAGKPITAIAHDFTLQPGVPLITVGESTCSGGASRVRLTQGEFSKDQPDKKPLAWRVPVILRSVGGGEPVRTLVSGGAASVGAARMRPRDRQRRPERLLPDALRAPAVRPHRLELRGHSRPSTSWESWPTAGRSAAPDGNRSPTCSISPVPRRRTPIPRSGARSRASSPASTNTFAAMRRCARPSGRSPPHGWRPSLRGSGGPRGRASRRRWRSCAAT